MLQGPFSSDKSKCENLFDIIKLQKKMNRDALLKTGDCVSKNARKSREEASLQTKLAEARKRGLACHPPTQVNPVQGPKEPMGKEVGSSSSNHSV